MPPIATLGQLTDAAMRLPSSIPTTGSGLIFALGGVDGADTDIVGTCSLSRLGLLKVVSAETDTFIGCIPAFSGSSMQPSCCPKCTPSASTSMAVSRWSLMMKVV